MRSEQFTFVMLKPDAIERGLQDAILSWIVGAGLQYEIIDTLTLSDDIVDAHYAEHVGKPFYPDLRAFTLSGPVTRLIVSGPDAVPRMRALLGPTDPSTAPAGTIRGEFNEGSGIVRRNLAHASDSPESAERELSLHTGRDELVGPGAVMTREFLARFGTQILNYLNHEEYDYHGKRYVVGWQSPQSDRGIAAGWMIYKRFEFPPSSLVYDTRDGELAIVVDQRNELLDVRWLSDPREIFASNAAEFAAVDASPIAMFGIRADTANDTTAYADKAVGQLRDLVKALPDSLVRIVEQLCSDLRHYGRSARRRVRHD